MSRQLPGTSANDMFNNRWDGSGRDPTLSPHTTRTVVILAQVAFGSIDSSEFADRVAHASAAVRPRTVGPHAVFSNAFARFSDKCHVYIHTGAG